MPYPLYPRSLRLILALALGLLLFATPPGRAQIDPDAEPPNPDFLAGRWPSCKDLQEACRDALDPLSILRAASIDGGTTGLSVGTCYAHSEASCPTCGCRDYVKLSWKRGQKGFDDGAGCVGYPNQEDLTAEQSRALAANILKALCASGACCCPQVAARACPVGTPVYARDSLTGSCCTYPNPCSVPPGWKTDPQETALCS